MRSVDLNSNEEQSFNLPPKCIVMRRERQKNKKVELRLCSEIQYHKCAEGLLHILGLLYGEAPLCLLFEPHPNSCNHIQHSNALQ